MYLGVGRSVNVLEVAISMPDYDTTLTYIYDRTSGMLLESTSKTTQTLPEPTTSEYSYSITETNIFQSTTILPIPLEYLVLVIAIIVVVAVVLVLALRKPTR